MEAYIIKQINSLMRNCESCGYKDQGWAIVRLDFDSDDDDKLIEDCINNNMMKVINKLEAVSKGLFEFGYEIKTGDWEICIEWSSKTLCPFENIRL